MYRIKYYSDGHVEPLRSRLVFFSNHQQVGLDYNESFATVAKITMVCAFLVNITSKH